MNQLRIALVAPSGSGKSTAAAMMKAAFERQHRRVEIHKLALPLYELQAAVYQACGRAPAHSRQDQPLLEALATQMRRIDPQSLVQHFARRLQASTADVVLNDDLRDDRVDWPWLQAAGFTVVRIAASPTCRHQRLAQRQDLSLVEASPLDAQIARIHADATIVNEDSLDRLRASVEAFVTGLAAAVRPVTPAP